jgi:hypothetical protein
MLTSQDTCGSCGRHEEPLEEVRRVYLVVDDEGTQHVTEVEGAEWWCGSCRATYPHLPL